MEYIQVTIPVMEQAQKEILIALLENVGFEGFEEQEEAVKAFINQEGYNEESLKELLAPFDLSYTLEIIAEQNWNATWEANFEPVSIPGFCTIRASFHDMKVETPYEIVITPKMSFGTGHHATTMLMMQQMAGMDFKDRCVLDFGTGTGILAILAEMLGAKKVLAIDNDEWAYENTKENLENNNCSRVEVKQASLDIAENGYDIILANINRHILLRHMGEMYKKLEYNGLVLMSGLLVADKEIVAGAAAAAGFRLKKNDEHAGWITLLFEK